MRCERPRVRAEMDSNVSVLSTGIGRCMNVVIQPVLIQPLTSGLPYSIPPLQTCPVAFSQRRALEAMYDLCSLFKARSPESSQALCWISFVQYRCTSRSQEKAIQAGEVCRQSCRG